MLKILAIVAMLAGLACAAPDDRWSVRRAERQREEGRFEQALETTERELYFDRLHPSERVVTLHEGVLRDLGRITAANAFSDFVRRYNAGEDTDTEDTKPTRSECKAPQWGFDLIDAWPRRGSGDPEMGTVAATFAIDESGQIRDLRVIRARYPGAAWFLIDAVDRVVISHQRIAEHRQVADLAFPVPVCVWWRYGPQDKHDLP